MQHFTDPTTGTRRKLESALGFRIQGLRLKVLGSFGLDRSKFNRFGASNLGLGHGEKTTLMHKHARGRPPTLACLGVGYLNPETSHKLA